MNKKAQGLSLNTIIIAIIVLIVLVVLIMVFTGYFGAKFTPGVTSCENSGGTCIFEEEEGAGCGYDSFGSRLATISGTCPGEQICCSKGLGSGETPVDISNCGKKGEAPCPGNQCDASKGLKLVDGTCLGPCKSTGGCVLMSLTGSGSCEDIASGAAYGYCDNGEVCCEKISSGTSDSNTLDSNTRANPPPSIPP